MALLGHAKGQDVGLERVIGDERRVVAAGALAVSLLAWVDVWRRTRHAEMSMAMPMPGMEPSMASGWEEIVPVAAMWAVMMVAMMLPSATPVLLVFSALQRKRRADGGAATPVWIFAGGYLVVWWAWSVLAASLQLVLRRFLLVSTDLAATSAVLGGALLLVAGVYQVTPLKTACLARCQSPIGFLLVHWRDGRRGAFQMGLRHGAYCVGCCWALMGLLFVGGVMNLLWIAGLALLVFVERLLPVGPWFARVSGGVMIAAALLILVRS